MNYVTRGDAANVDLVALGAINRTHVQLIKTCCCSKQLNNIIDKSALHS